MKRFFTLLIALIAILGMVSAQERISILNNEWTMPKTIDEIMPTRISSSSSFGNTPRRSKYDGVYYTKPSGSLYYAAFSDDGAISFYLWLTLPPWQSSTFTNMSPNPKDCKWLLYSPEYTNNPTIQADITSMADEDGNLPLSFDPGWGVYGGPFVEYNDILYSLGDFSIYWGPRIMAYNDFLWLSFNDNRHFGDTGTTLDTFYAVGTGNYKGEMEGIDANGDTITVNGTYKCSGVYQTFPAPASPLYVKNLYLHGIAFTRDTSYEPIKNNAVVTLDIIDTATNEILETLTTTTGNFNYWTWWQYSGTGERYISGSLKFSKKVIDPILGETDEPIVIDRATTFRVSGLENQDDINLGLRLHKIYECDGDEEYYTDSSVLTFIDPSNTITPISKFSYTEYSLGVMFDALMDKVIVADTLLWPDGSSFDGYNVLRISEDGMTCSNDIDGGEQYNIGALYTYTCCDWFDADGVANYSLDETPDWIKEINVDTSNYDYTQANYCNLVSFVADPLPEGVEGRAALVHLKGRGYTDSTPVYILQGNADKDDATGIVSIPTTTNTTTNYKGTYSISGQRVNHSTKGVIIKEGKKILNK